MRPAEYYKEALRDLCNVDMHLQDEVARAVPNWHRAIQALLFRFVLKVLRELATQEHYDGRNEHVVLAARELVAFYEQWRATTDAEPYTW